MKNRIKWMILIVMAHLVNVAVAQTIDTVRWRIHYATSSREVEESRKPRQDERILDIGHTVSYFYSLWDTRYREVRDSVIKKGVEIQDVMNACSKVPYPKSYSSYLVFKNYPQKGTLTFTENMFKDYIYQEEMEIPQWQMVSGDTSIAGYRCEKAITHFRGRTWTAWFAPEIPISDGPWKLYGLPGLILQATDDKGYFNFKCIQIEKGKNQPIIFQNHKYISCSRKQLNQLHIKKAKDLDGWLKDMGMGECKGWGRDGKPLVYKPKTAILMDE